MFEVKLPSGKSIAVKAPSYYDRLETVKEWRKTNGDAGYSADELMCAKCVVGVDGNSVNPDMIPDPILIIADWSNQDVQYYMEFFMTAFFLDDKLRERAANEAKKLMTGQLTAKTSSKK